MATQAQVIFRLFQNILHIFHTQSIPTFLAQGSALRYHAFTIAFYAHWLIISLQFVLLYLSGWLLFVKCNHIGDKAFSTTWAQTFSPMFVSSGFGLLKMCLCLVRLHVEGKLDMRNQSCVLLVSGLVSDWLSWGVVRVLLALHLDGVVVFHSMRLLVLPLILDLPIRLLNQSINRAVAPYNKPIDTVMYQITAILAAFKIDHYHTWQWQWVFIIFWVLLGSFVVALCFFCLVNVAATARLFSNPRAIVRRLSVTLIISLGVGSVVLPELISLINLTLRLNGRKSVSNASIFLPILVLWSGLALLAVLLLILLVYTVWLHWDPQSLFFESSAVDPRTPQRVVELQPLAEPLELLRLSSSLFRLAEATFDNSTASGVMGEIDNIDGTINNDSENILDHGGDLDIYDDDDDDNISRMEQGRTLLLNNPQQHSTSASATTTGFASGTEPISTTTTTTTLADNNDTTDTLDSFVVESNDDRVCLIAPTSIKSHVSTPTPTPTTTTTSTTPSTATKHNKSLLQAQPPQPQQQSQQQSHQQECVACNDQIPDTIFLPCGHSVCCLQCAQQWLVQRSPQCPLCRTEVESFVKIESESPDGFVHATKQFRLNRK